MLEVAGFDFEFADFVFLDFAAEGGGEFIDEADVFGDFEVGDLIAAPFADFFLGGGLVRAEADPCANDFAEAAIRDADDLDFADFWWV